MKKQVSKGTKKPAAAKKAVKTLAKKQDKKIEVKKSAAKKPVVAKKPVAAKTKVQPIAPVL